MNFSEEEFRILQDKDGFLTADDLHTALGRSEDVKQLIAAADINGDGGSSAYDCLLFLLCEKVDRNSLLSAQSIERHCTYWNALL